MDTGLHTKAWTRQQAIDYGLETSEVERYVVNPGQACAYMLGQLKLSELRDRAQPPLATSSTRRRSTMLGIKKSTAPLTMIKEQVDRYIAANR